MDKTRRNFLGAAGLAALGLFAGTARTQTPAASCYDPSALSLSQKNQRRSLSYASPSPHADKRCGLCAFFTAGEGQCGTCQMLSGGPVETGAVCTSFAPRS